MIKNKDVPQWYSVEIIYTPERKIISAPLTLNDIQDCILSILRKVDSDKINSYLHEKQIFTNYNMFRGDEYLYEGFFPLDNPQCSPFLCVKEKDEEASYYRYFVWATSCENAIKTIKNMIDYGGLE